MISTLVYVVPAVLCVWPFCRVVLPELAIRPSDMDDPGMRALAVLIAAFGAALWPVILTIWLAFRVSRAVWARVLGPDEPAEVDR